MKLNEYAKQIGVSYRTAWRWWKLGTIKGFQRPSGTIVVTENLIELKDKVCNVAIYARVSSSENKSNLDTQCKRLQEYCSAKGYQVIEVIKEIGSGVNDNRRLLSKLLKNKSLDIIVVEHKDRLTRFGFNYINELLEIQGRSIEVVNLVDDKKEDLIQDFVSIITSFCSRLYGQRRCKRKTEKIIAEIKSNE